MFTDLLIKTFEENKDSDAIIWQDQVFSYEWMLERLNKWLDKFKSENINPGTVTVIEADFSPNSVALFLALTEIGAIIVPLTKSVEANKPEFIEIAQGEISISIDGKDKVSIKRLQYSPDHELYRELQNRGHPGLVVFSSGSTGKSKAIVHDAVNILEKFKIRRHSMRAITFLLFDHLGGINTMLYTLSNAGCMVTVQDRSPDGVLAVVEKYKLELLPASPTFLNLILLGEAYNRYDISSLKLVTYGTEPMPKSTLERFHKLFPKIQLLQTYGLSEVGVLRSKSKSSDSLWVKIGGEGFQTRVVDGLLQIKAKSAMLGYLNAPSPFTEDRWLVTGDMVEVDGDYLKILGRKSEIINVGGEKVYPAEVENVILEMDNVEEVTVYGEKNPIMGNIVCAKLKQTQPEDKKGFTSRLKKHCRTKLQEYKIPVKILISEEQQYSERYKKKRI